MKIHDCEQDSPEWSALRIGIPTASALGQIVTPSKLTESAQRFSYIDRLAAEWLMNQPMDDFGGNFWTDRGAALESRARRYFAAATGLEARTVGFVTTDDPRVGCSPDALVYDGGELVGGLELKCPSLPTHIGYWRRRALPRDYRMQVQGSMWVTGLASWWFQSYHPDGPPFVIEVERDEAVQDSLDEFLPIFCAELARVQAELEAAGCRPVEAAA